jgi:hypothetical protein
MKNAVELVGLDLDFHGILLGMTNEAGQGVLKRLNGDLVLHDSGIRQDDDVEGFSIFRIHLKDCQIGLLDSTKNAVESLNVEGKDNLLRALIDKRIRIKA